MLDVVVLISGTGSNLAALLAAAQQPNALFRVVAVGADRDAAGLAHAQKYGVPTFILRPRDFADRAAWGQALAAKIRNYGVSRDQGLVVSAGLMRILPPVFVQEFAPRLINTHPALLPLFPGAHAVADALAVGATVTGTTVHVIDEGVDTGPILRQAKVQVLPADTEATLHERIKAAEVVLLPQTVAEIARGELELPEITK